MHRNGWFISLRRRGINRVKEHDAVRTSISKHKKTGYLLYRGKKISEKTKIPREINARDQFNIKRETHFPCFSKEDHQSSKTCRLRRASLYEGLAEMPALLFFLFAFSLPPPGVIGLFSAPFPAAFTVLSVLIGRGFAADADPVAGVGGCNLPTPPVPLPVFCRAVAAAEGFPFVLERRKDPGSPTRGLSSINSSPYLEKRLNDSVRFLVSCIVDPALVSKLCVVPCDINDCWISGIGVFSLLCCRDCCCCWPAASSDLGTGGIYVCPYEGEKIGSGDAVERTFVRDVTVESYM